MIPNSIIIHGPGRSGSTLLSNILCLHPELGWISGYVNRYPYLPILSILNRIQAIKALEQLSRGRRKWPRPAEAYGFWEYFFPDFNRPALHKNIIAKTRDKSQQCIHAIESILRYSSKQRFITKITGLPRVEILSRIFEDPFIIYINRDPRAVVMSYYKQRWGYKGKLDAFEAIQFEEHIMNYAQRYRESWCGIDHLKEFEFMLVRYENLLETDRFIDSILEFTRLEKTSRFSEVIRSWHIHSGKNDRWREMLSPSNIEIVENCLKDLLHETGYA